MVFLWKAFAVYIVVMIGTAELQIVYESVPKLLACAGDADFRFAWCILYTL